MRTTYWSMRPWWLTGGLLIAICSLSLRTTSAPAGSHSTALVAPPDTVARHLRGRVLDAYTTEPLPYASLWLKHLAIGTQADEQGYFAIPLTAEQLTMAPIDTLQATAAAFRLQLRPVVFRRHHPDSLLRISLARDSAMAQHAPVLLAPTKRRRQPGTTLASTPAEAQLAPPRRTFWQRLFGPRL